MNLIPDLMSIVDKATEEQKRIISTGLSWILKLIGKNKAYGSSVFKSPILAPNMKPCDSIRVRMSDKIQRITSLMSKSRYRQLRRVN